MRPRVLLLALPLLASCALAHEREVDAAIDAPAPAIDAAVIDATPSHELWVLVHPSDAPLGAGIYRFDEARQQILAQLPLPPGATSPHGLAWDGTSLWLGDVGTPPDDVLYQLAPDGTVLQRLAGFGSEGVAVDGDTLWVAVAAELVQITHEGRVLRRIPIAGSTVQDLVLAGGALDYLVNDDLDRIVHVDPTTSVSSELARGLYVAPYSLGYDGASLAVAVDGMILRFEPMTGARLSSSAFAVPGWITAIAFVPPAR